MTKSKKASFLASSFLMLTYGVSAEAQGFDRSTRTSEHMEPSIIHADNEKEATKKLKELEQRIGSKPNIVWFVVDDMGYGDPGCYGGGEAIGAATPHMDKLAADGMRLTSCYAQNTSTPTRSALLTGRLPVRTGLIRPILAGDELKSNPWDEEVSLAKVLSNKGYTTVLSGKWHIGEGEGLRPHDVGFDEFYGYFSAQKEITQRYDPRRYPDLVLDEEKLSAFLEVAPDDQLIYGFKGGETRIVSQIESTEDMGRADQVLADFSVKKIKELASSGSPFFLEHSFMKVHTDNFNNPDYPPLSKSRYQYKNAIAEVDMHIGNIVKALDEAGVLENTFIFVTSDNGPQMDAWPDAGYTPFYGAKGTTWEGGVRVPGIAYWKGMIEPGQVHDGIFDLMDLFGTSLRIAGVDAKKELPSDRYYDFIDQTSFLLTEQEESNREKVYFWWKDKLMSCRMREYKVHIKAIVPESNPHLWIDYSSVKDVGTAPWLFNLYIDPKEQSPVGHAMNAWLATLNASLKKHAETFKKYPPRNIGL